MGELTKLTIDVPSPGELLGTSKVYNKSGQVIGSVVQYGNLGPESYEELKKIYNSQGKSYDVFTIRVAYNPDNFHETEECNIQTIHDLNV